MIAIPKRLEERLSREAGLHGQVLQSIQKLSTWLGENKLTFFPEYTDHGLQHINRVLLTADWLIPEKALDSMTAEDIATLALSAALHDAALHLSEDSFIFLVSGRMRSPLSGFGDVDWMRLWNEYLFEASRFDEQTLERLFGNRDEFRPPPLDKKSLTYRDRLVIGHFLRRHHPRLAHEFAVFGVPLSGGNYLSFANTSQHISNLTGFVARSHGLDLRKSVDGIPKDERIQSDGVHLPYISNYSGSGTTATEVV